MTVARINFLCFVVCVSMAAANAPFAVEGHAFNALAAGWCAGIAYMIGLRAWLEARR